MGSSASIPLLIHDRRILKSKHYVLQSPTAMALHQKDLLVLDTKKQDICSFDAVSGKFKGVISLFGADPDKTITLQQPSILLVIPETQLFIFANQEHVWLLQRTSSKHLELKRSFRCPMEYLCWHDNHLLTFKKASVQVWSLQGVPLQCSPRVFETKGEPVVSTVTTVQKHTWIATTWQAWCVVGQDVKHRLYSKSPITAVAATDHFLVLALGMPGLWARLALFHLTTGELLQQIDLEPKEDVHHLLIDHTTHKLFVSCSPDAKVLMFKISVALFDNQQVHHVKPCVATKQEAWFEWAHL